MNTEERSRGVSERKPRVAESEMRNTSVQTESIVNRFEPVEFVDPADSRRRAEIFAELFRRDQAGITDSRIVLRAEEQRPE